MRIGRDSGFTLVELIIVVAIIGILVTVAMPVYKDSVQRSREATLREDLYILRDSIDQYYTDNGAYPESLQTLVEKNYIKGIPVDPLTKSAETWTTEQAESDDSATPDTPTGIKNVKSGATGNGLDGTPFSEW
jgi:general secretion pathway protein G